MGIIIPVIAETVAKIMLKITKLFSEREIFLAAAAGIIKRASTKIAPTIFTLATVINAIKITKA